MSPTLPRVTSRLKAYRSRWVAPGARQVQLRGAGPSVEVGLQKAGFLYEVVADNHRPGRVASRPVCQGQRSGYRPAAPTGRCYPGLSASGPPGSHARLHRA